LDNLSKSFRIKQQRRAGAYRSIVKIRKNTSSKAILDSGGTAESSLPFLDYGKVNIDLCRQANPKEYSQLIYFSAVGFLPHYPQTIAVFYSLAISSLPLQQLVYTADLYALGFLLPGSYLQSFFLVLKSHSFSTLFFSYIALYLPSLLCLYIYFSLKDKIKPTFWKSISNLMAWLSQGLILITIFRLVGE